ncbi:MAG: phytanoyl-CoA dioxygenase family protein [Oceanicaulis sp.]
MSATFDTEGFMRDGYTVLKSAALEAVKAAAEAEMLETGRHIARRIVGRAEGDTLGDLLAFLLREETDQAATRACYEVFPTLPGVLALINAPVFLDAAREAGLARPVAGTCPLVRLDRPADTRFSTPAHQDWWYSMLSKRAVVIWTGIGALSEDMGPVQLVAGSHADGLAEFKRYEAGHEWFECAAPAPDARFQPALPGADEAVVFDQRVIHRSGVNRSDRVRVSIQLRYNDLETAAAMTTTFTPSLSRWVLARQDEHLEAGARRAG